MCCATPTLINSQAEHNSLSGHRPRCYIEAIEGHAAVHGMHPIWAHGGGYASRHACSTNRRAYPAAGHASLREREKVRYRGPLTPEQCTLQQQAHRLRRNRVHHKLSNRDSHC